MKFFGWIFLTIPPAGILASPTGASACPGGMAAVGGMHLTATTVTNGTLSDGGFRVMIDKRTLDTDSMARLRSGETYNIQIVGADFKGFLIRVDKNANGDPVIFTEDSNFVRIANTCTDDVAGLTHTFNSVKTSVMGSINVPQDGVYPMDVTVVVSNSGGLSEFYYTAYNITTDPNADPPSDDDGTEDSDLTVDPETSAAFDGLSLILGALSMAVGSAWMIFV